MNKFFKNLSTALSFTLFFYSAYTHAGVNDVREYKSDFMKKCVSDGETKSLCNCAFDRWSAELSSTRSPSALAAGRLLILPDDQTPESSDISKGVREMQTMGLAVQSCAEQHLSGGSEQDAYEVVKGIQDQNGPDFNGISIEQTQAAVSDMLAKAMSGQVGGGDAETEADMQAILRQMGRGDLAGKINNDGSYNLADMKAMETIGKTQAELQAEQEHQQRNQSYTDREAKRPQRDKLKAQIVNSNPTLRPVSSYEEAHSLNCEVNGFSKHFCNCEWTSLKTVLGSNDGPSARIAGAFVAVSTADLSDVDRKAQDKAWLYLDSHRMVSANNCRE